MNGKSAWSVKGVDHEARAAAKIAARRAGLTVGAWLTQTIRHAAAQEIKSEPGNHYAGFGAATAPPQSPPPHPSGPQPLALTLEAVLESVQNLSSRIQQSEDRAQEAIAPIASKVQDLTEQMVDIKGTGPAVVAPMERALSRVAERLDRIEQDSRQDGHASGDRGGLLSRLFGRGE